MRKVPQKHRLSGGERVSLVGNWKKPSRQQEEQVYSRNCFSVFGVGKEESGE